MYGLLLLRASRQFNHTKETTMKNLTKLSLAATLMFLAQPAAANDYHDGSRNHMNNPKHMQSSSTHNDGNRGTYHKSRSMKNRSYHSSSNPSQGTYKWMGRDVSYAGDPSNDRDEMRSVKHAH
jgi:hypothetical protein